MAVNTYQQIAQSTSDPKIKSLLLDIAKEEKVHAGEFQKALDYLAGSEEEGFIKDGEKEASKKLK